MCRRSVTRTTYSASSPPYDPANGLTTTSYRTRVEIPSDHQGGTFWYHPHVQRSAAVQLSVTAVDGRPLDTPVWQDTIGINRAASVTMRVRFKDFAGRALVHCHQLQHEDRGMMQLIEYVA